MKATISTLGLISLALIMLSGCASAPQRPEWLSGDTAKYRSTDDLLGRGEAPTLEQAKDRARADLAKIFEVAVSEASEDVRAFKSSAEGGKVKSGSESRVARTTLTHTERVLQGVRIAEMWQDPKTQNHFALAVLPRAQAAAGVRQEIAQLDEATQRYLDQSRDAKDLLDKIAAAEQAVRAQAERDGYQKTLKVVDRSGQGMPSSWSSARLRADADDLRKRLRLAIHVDAASPPTLSASVAGALSAAGYVTVADNEADYVLDTRVNLTEPVLREGWYWSTGAIEIQLRERAGERIRGTQHWPIKGSAQEPAMAQQRAWDQVDAVLKRGLGAALTGFTMGKDNP